MIFSRLFHKNIRTEPFQIPTDRDAWPAAWKTVQFKQYRRYPLMALPIPTSVPAPLTETMTHRSTQRDFSSTTPLSLQTLSNLLHYTFGLRGIDLETTQREPTTLAETRRHYPSGGARYPLEVYLVANNIDACARGVYHYDVVTHGLRVLGDETQCTTIAADLRHPNVRAANCTIVITAKQTRNAMKYGDHGYDMISIEVGHASQNLLLLATALKQKTMPFFGYDYDALTDHLDLDPDELPFYAIALGA